jgi:hypothetical protein
MVLLKVERGRLTCLAVEISYAEDINITALRSARTAETGLACSKGCGHGECGGDESREGDDCWEEHFEGCVKILGLMLELMMSS